MRKTASLAAALFFLAAVAFAAAPAPRKLLSPPGQAAITVHGATITVTYHRPYIRNPKPPHHPRLIFGAGSNYLVPFGHVWRLGANQATALTTSKAIVLAGVHLAAGSYTLFATPNASHWTLIISKKTGEWGIPYAGRQYDLARANLRVHPSVATIDPFTISFHRIGPRSAQLHFAWAHTIASVPLRVP